MKTLAEKEKLETISKMDYDAFVNQDIERLNGYHDSAWEGFYANFQWQGINASLHKYNADAIGTKIAIESREWMIAPELAVARSRENWVWPDGSAAHYLTTMVWKNTDGQWYLAHTHFSEYKP